MDVDVHASEDDYYEDDRRSNMSEQPDESSSSSSSESGEYDSSSSADEGNEIMDTATSKRSSLDLEVTFKNQKKKRIQAESDSEDELDPRDPRVKRLLSRMLKEDLREEEKERSTRRKNRDRENRRKNKPSKYNSIKQRNNKTTDKSYKSSSARTMKNFKQSNAIKSPSDTTIYAPALNRDFGSPNRVTNNLVMKHHNKAIDHISDFVERVRLETKDVTTPTKSSGYDRRDKKSCSKDREVFARGPADELIVQAERFKANIEPPKGKSPSSTDDDSDSVCDDPNENVKQLIRLLKRRSDVDGDDEFFHITCHIDGATKEKIGKGEFIELERLLPKSRAQIMNNDQGIQIIRKDGSSFVLPEGGNGKEPKITNIRKWEQAFRVYAAVYSEYNPDRSAEIWQYVHIINSAATSFVWENVAFYDFTFRQLMHSNPKRSWAKIYTQMWNLAMRDHVPNRINGGSSGNPNYSSGSVTASQKSNDWREKVCWRFKKGKCKKWDCRYDHRCSICGAYSHADFQCKKKKTNYTTPYSKNAPQEGSGSGAPSASTSQLSSAKLPN